MKSDLCIIYAAHTEAVKSCTHGYAVIIYILSQTISAIIVIFVTLSCIAARSYRCINPSIVLSGDIEPVPSEDEGKVPP